MPILLVWRTNLECTVRRAGVVGVQLEDNDDSGRCPIAETFTICQVRVQVKVLVLATLQRVPRFLGAFQTLNFADIFLGRERLGLYLSLIRRSTIDGYRSHPCRFETRTMESRYEMYSKEMRVGWVIVNIRVHLRSPIQRWSWCPPFGIERPSPWFTAKQIPKFINHSVTVIAT